MLGLRRKAQPRSRLEVRVAELRAWWFAHSEIARARIEGYLRQMASAGRALLEDPELAGAGAHFWAVVKEAAKAHIAYDKEPPELLVWLKLGFPEIWPLVEPQLPAGMAEKVSAVEAEVLGRG